MSTARKLWIAAGVLLVLSIGGWLLAVGAAYAMGGVMSVRLVDRDGGRDIRLPVPMALLEAAASSLDSPVISAAGLGRVRVDGRSVDLGAVGPALLEILEELDQLPDATLVEVSDGRGTVRVAKAGARLVVKVDDPGSSITVSVPTRGAVRLAGRLLD